MMRKNQTRLKNILSLLFLLIISCSLLLIADFNAKELQWTSKAKSYKFKGKPLGECAIVYLLSPSQQEIESFKKSLVKLKENFLTDFPQYPVIGFYDAKLSPERVQKLKQFNQEVIKIDLRLIEIPYTFPSHFKDGSKPVSVNFGYPFYNHMIHFWFVDVFRNDFIKGLQYFWRLDTDSFIHSKVQFDPFAYMSVNKLKYAFRTDETRDSDFVVVGLLDTVNEQIKNSSIATQISTYNDQFYETPMETKTQKKGARIMYNNFEIVHVPTFSNLDKSNEILLGNITYRQRNNELQNFIKFIDHTDRIYTHRWGDAPLRYNEVGMFLLWDKEVWNFCQVDYEHAHHNYRYSPCDAPLKQY